MDTRRAALGPTDEPSLQRPGVVPGIRQSEAAGVAQHVRVDREWHRNIQHTVRYTELAADRFKDFWR
jgi:hypothetical protein